MRIRSKKSLILTLTFLMIFYQKLFKKLQSLWNMLSEKGEKQGKFIIYLLLIEVFIIILILGIHKETADLAVALGTISMALVIVYIEIIKPWLQKPEIKIEFANEPPYCHPDKGKKGSRIYWCHFAIFNNGRSQADDCEVVLERVWVGNNKKENLEREERKFIPSNLKWSAEDRAKDFERACFKTIYPGGRRYFCDIARVKEKGNEFNFELARPLKSQDNSLPRGKHEIQISIYSKNGAKATKKFGIDWCGEWKGTQPEMQECLEIKMS